MSKDKQIPTAEDFVASIDTDIFAEGAVYSESGYSSATFAKGLREFTAIHVKAALEEAAKKATLSRVSGDDEVRVTISKNSILSAYPLENIK